MPDKNISILLFPVPRRLEGVRDAPGDWVTWIRGLMQTRGFQG